MARATTLNLISEDDFVLKFSLKTLKATISSRREIAAVMQEMDEKDLGYRSIIPIMVPHIHQGTNFVTQGKIVVQR